MKNSLDCIDKRQWLKEGFVLQISKNRYFIGQGPFQKKSQACAGLYHPDFFMKNKQPWLQAKKQAFVNDEELRNFLTAETAESTKNIKNQVCITKPASFVKFQQDYQEIKNNIKDKKIEKMVILVCEELKGKIQVNHIINKIFKKSSKYQSYIYGVWNASSGLAGLTPEILFSVKKNQFDAMALAGTSVHPGACLFYNPKELKEHAYVIQSIEESLKKIVTWQTQKTYEKPIGSIKHLCTDKQGTLKKPFSFLKTIQSLHPTAALGVYPKKNSWQFLKHQDRSFFGAPLAYFNGKDEACCLVAIRNIEWSHSKIKIRSGAGIVADSNLQKEWQELSLKRQQVKNVFFET